MEEKLAEINRHIAKLDDPNKVERKRNLEKLKNVFEQNFPMREQFQDDDVKKVLILWQDRLFRPILRCLGSDPSERVREISGDFVLIILDFLPNFESGAGSADCLKMDYLIPLLQSRLVRFQSFNIMLIILTDLTLTKI